MGDLVLSNVKEGNWVSGLLAKLLLTGKLINEKLPFKINIPIFHHSIIPSAGQELKPHKFF
jgi:hypothetical protein